MYSVHVLFQVLGPNMTSNAIAQAMQQGSSINTSEKKGMFVDSRDGNVRGLV